MFVINNFDAVIEENDSLVDELITITRECQRYGIYVILVCNNTNVVSRRLSLNFLTIDILSNSNERKEMLTLKLSDIDKEIVDIQHYIEFGKFNCYQGWMCFKMLQNALQQRRKIHHFSDFHFTVDTHASDKNCFVIILANGAIY